MVSRIRSALILAALGLASFQAQAQGYTERPGYWHYDWGWGHMLFGSLMMILFWGGVTLLVVLAARWIGSGSTSQSALLASRSALDVLKERFARGEIDQAEFEQRKKLLSH
jgi:putative membrane protein